MLLVHGGGDEELVFDVDKVLASADDIDIRVRNGMLKRNPVTPSRTTPDNLT